MTIPGRVLKLHPHRGGYLVAALSRNRRMSHMKVHRLVLMAFVGPCPDGMEACHNDGDRANNVLENLRWDTKSANMADKRRHGNDWFASKTHCVNDHEFTPENTYSPPSRPTHRMCRQCMRERQRAARSKGAAA